MGHLLDGLDDLGLGDMSKMEVYQDIKEVAGANRKQGTDKQTEKHEMSEADFLFEKSFKCPACDFEFKAKAVRVGKAKLTGADTDLRPKYAQLDPLKYDAVVCPRCGYAAITRFFAALTYPQAKLIMAQISPKFHAPAEPKDVYSYDDAILRHRLALVSAMVKKSKISERAYVCLKTAWLLRGKAEGLENEKEIKELQEQELEFLQNAYSGFTEALSKEASPICGMDETTMMILLAELARKTGHTDDAIRMVSKVITSRTASERIKEKARVIKEMIAEGTTE